MSNYVPRPNSGTLWPNNKRSDNHPDVRGDAFLDRQFLQNLLRNSDDELIKVQVSGWAKVIAGKDCVSLSFSEPYEKPQTYSKPAAKPVSDDEVPF